MAVDIVTTLMNALVIEEGLEISDTFFRDLAITYQALAEEQIKKYSDDAGFNNLIYDRDAEENLVKNVFRNSIASHFRHVKGDPEKGLAEALLSVEGKSLQSVFETPQTVSWERVSNKLPRIFYDLIEVVEAEKQRFA